LAVRSLFFFSTFRLVEDCLNHWIESINTEMQAIPAACDVWWCCKKVGSLFAAIVVSLDFQISEWVQWPVAEAGG
jgi:hypothetical protein